MESAAKELGYVPNLAARALASQRTEVIGVLIPSLTNNVFSDVLRGIYDASEGSRYSIQLANTRYSILQEEKLLRLFQAQKPAGLIVTGIDQTAESRSVMEAMNCPIVQIMEIGPDPVDMMVGFSHYDAAFAAVSHLIAQGFRRIGFLGAQMDPRVQRRLDGYRDAMKAASLFDPRLDHHDPGAYHRDAGRHAVRRSACRARPTSTRSPASMTTSRSASCSNASAGIFRFPNDIAIVGFNDLEFMASTVPPLSSVRTNRYEMGSSAVTMVTAAIEGHRPPEPVIDLGFELMVRQSSVGAGRPEARWHRSNPLVAKKW